MLGFNLSLEAFAANVIFMCVAIAGQYWRTDWTYFTEFYFFNRFIFFLILARCLRRYKKFVVERVPQPYFVFLNIIFFLFFYCAIWLFFINYISSILLDFITSIFFFLMVVTAFFSQNLPSLLILQCLKHKRTRSFFFFFVFYCRSDLNLESHPPPILQKKK